MVFKSETEALRFLAGANNNSASEESGDDDSVEEVYTIPRPAPARHSAPVRAAKPPPEVAPKDPAEPLFTSVTDVSPKANRSNSSGIRLWLRVKSWSAFVLKECR
jgi:hypothetical protein